MLKELAGAIGDADGDEMVHLVVLSGRKTSLTRTDIPFQEALEAREAAISHLRFLDMAAYNNVFNPIASEGTSGATKELVRSYYEDPVNELKATITALEAIIELAR